MTSPTATFCCLLPARTTAYTASHSPRGSAKVWKRPWVARKAHRGSTLLAGRSQGQNGSAGREQESALARALALDRHVHQREAALVVVVLRVVAVPVLEVLKVLGVRRGDRLTRGSRVDHAALLRRLGRSVTGHGRLDRHRHGLDGGVGCRRRGSGGASRRTTTGAGDQ